MASNTQLNLADTVGDKLLTKEVTHDGDATKCEGVFVGIITGTEGAYTYTVNPGGAGAVTAGTQRMTLASDDPAVALLTAIDADTSRIPAVGQAAMAASVPVVIASDQSDVPITLDGETVAVTGTFWQATQPVSGTVTANLGATDNAVLDAIAASLAGTLTVQVTSAPTTAITAAALPLPSGAATEATLATLSGNVTACNTGAVVVSSGTITTVSAVTAITDALPAGNNVVGQVKITDGTEVANVNASNQLEVEVKNASLTVDATGSGDVPVTLDGEAVVLGAGSAAIGKLAANSGVDIGDVDVTSIAAGTSTIGGVIGQTSSSTMYDGTTAATVKRASGLAASGTTAMVAAVPGYQIRVLAIALFATSGTVTNVYIANDDNDLLGDSSNPIPLAVDADGDNSAGFVLPWNPGGWFQTDTDNEALNLILSAAQDVIYAVTYIEVT